MSKSHLTSSITSSPHHLHLPLYLQDACKSPNFCVYIGYTGVLLENEHLRWLTARGLAFYDDSGKIIPGTQKRNRPALLKMDSTTITMSEATKIFGFKSLIVYKELAGVRVRMTETMQTHHALFAKKQRMPMINWCF